MSAVAAAIGAAVGIGGALISSGSASSASNKAAAAETQANQAAIAEQRRQFDVTQQNQQPFLQAGQSALQQQLALLGLAPPTQGTQGQPGQPGQVNYGAYVNGNPDLANAYNSSPQLQQQFGTPDAFGQFHYQTFGQGEGRDLSPYTGGATAGTPGLSGGDQQQSAINALQASPLYQSLFRNGQDTLLNNAAATGGLRGGNTAHSLANFGADTLAQVIQNQIGNLGQIAGQGQNSTNVLGQQGANSSNNISQLLAQSGQARSGGILASSGANQNAIGGISRTLGGLFGQGGGFSHLFGGAGSGGISNFFAPSAGLIGSAGNTIASNPGIF